MEDSLNLGGQNLLLKSTFNAEQFLYASGPVISAQFTLKIFVAA